MKTYQSELRSVEPIPPLRSEWRSVEVCRGKQEDEITFVSNWLILPPPWSIGCDPLSREVFIEFFFYKNAHLSCCTFDLNAAASFFVRYVGQIRSLILESLLPLWRLWELTLFPNGLWRSKRGEGGWRCRFSISRTVELAHVWRCECE